MSFQSIRFSGQPCDEMREIFWLVSLLKSKIVCVWLLDCILECEWLNVHWTQAIEVRRQDETMSRYLAGNTYDWDFNLGLFISPNVIIVIHIHLHFLKGVLSGGIHNWMTWNPACFFSFFFPSEKQCFACFLLSQSQREHWLCALWEPIFQPLLWFWCEIMELSLQRYERYQLFCSSSTQRQLLFFISPYKAFFSLQKGGWRIEGKRRKSGSSMPWGLE